MSRAFTPITGVPKSVTVGPSGPPVGGTSTVSDSCTNRAPDPPPGSYVTALLTRVVGGGQLDDVSVIPIDELGDAKLGRVLSGGISSLEVRWSDGDGITQVGSASRRSWIQQNEAGFRACTLTGIDKALRNTDLRLWSLTLRFVCPEERPPPPSPPATSSTNSAGTASSTSSAAATATATAAATESKSDASPTTATGSASSTTGPTSRAAVPALNPPSAGPPTTVYLTIGIGALVVLTLVAFVKYRRSQAVVKSLRASMAEKPVADAGPRASSSATSVQIAVGAAHGEPAAASALAARPTSASTPVTDLAGADDSSDVVYLPGELSSSPRVDPLRAVRAVKNAVIGNRTHKARVVEFPGAVPRLCALATSVEVPADLRAQAAMVLGSLAAGDDEFVEFLAAQGVTGALLQCLEDTDERVAEAAARALKAMFASPRAPRVELYREAPIRALVRLVQRGASPSDSPTARRIAEFAAHVLASSCDSAPQQSLAAACGAVTAVLQLLAAANGTVRTLTAALDALGALCRENSGIAGEVVRAHCNLKPVSALLMQLLAAPDADLRLMAATCATNIYRTNVLPEHEPEMARALLPALLKLMAPEHKPNVKECACLVFANLVQDSEDLQTLAAEADTMVRLVEVVRLALQDAEVLPGASTNPGPIPPVSTTATGAAVPPPPASGTTGSSASALLGKQPTAASSLESSPLPPGVPGPTEQYAKRSAHQARVGEAALLAAAAGTALHEPARKAALDAGLIPWILRGMAHPAVGVRAAACHAARSISRSVKAVRTALVDAGIAEPLVQRLGDEAPAVLLSATAAVCNLVLDFAPMKQSILARGGIQRLAELARPAFPASVRVNAVWALKNLVYNASTAVKSSVMQHLTYAYLGELIEQSDDVGMVSQALNLVRNLAVGSEDDIQQVIDGYGGAARFFGMVSAKLASATPEHAHEAVFIVNNVATGSDAQKNALMQDRGILDALLALMDHPQPAVRAGVVWVLINLTWPEDAQPTTRVRYLRTLGFERRLIAMQAEADVELRDRVRAALMQFADA
ncbi:hypothetical protein H9P43_006378 [Blastocladiella emersonii ATCC 22665]|nr:hypothetical protein H9P43_006378 [Blastocladiella emersonii ATCC 22665]